MIWHGLIDLLSNIPGQLDAIQKANPATQVEAVYQISPSQGLIIYRSNA